MPLVCKSSVVKRAEFLKNFNVDIDASAESVCVDDLMGINERSDVCEKSVYLACEANGDETMEIVVADEGSPIVEFVEHASVEENEDGDERRDDRDEDDFEVNAAVCGILPSDVPCEGSGEVLSEGMSAVDNDDVSDVDDELQAVGSGSKGTISYGYQEQVEYDLNRKFKYLKNEPKKTKNLRRIIKNKNVYIRNLHKKLVARACHRLENFNTVEDLKLQLSASKNREQNLITQMSKIMEQNSEITRQKNQAQKENCELKTDNRELIQLSKELTKQNTNLQDRYFQLNNEFLQVTQNPRNTLIHAKLNPDTLRIDESKQMYVEAECEHVENACCEGVCLHFVVKHVGKIGVNVKPPF